MKQELDLSMDLLGRASPFHVRWTAASALIAALCVCGAMDLGGSGAFAAGLPRCLGKPATIVAREGGLVAGTARADVIVTGSGIDLIHAGGGNDRICSGGGDDQIDSEVGSDMVDAGSGADVTAGGNGSDWVLGGAGEDMLVGNRGNDRLYGGSGERDFVDGGLGDDTVSGGPGSFDQVIGSVGNDDLSGGPGDGDILRGDHGKDFYRGGVGLHDVASFAVSGFAGPIFGGNGVVVDLEAGTASQDGQDRLEGIEDVIGTPFSDLIHGSAVPNVLYGGGGGDGLTASGPDDVAFGGLGQDGCHGFASEDCARGFRGLPTAPALEVDLAGGADATSLTAVVPFPMLVKGGGIDVVVAFQDGAWILRESRIPIEVGERCIPVTPAEVRCPVEGKPDAVLVSGSAEGDRIEIDPGVPSFVSALLTGEREADTLIGGSGDDSLRGAPNFGPTADVLEGRGGDDALTDGLMLSGGPGSDLLIGDPCIGQVIDGGVGVDSASFARTFAGLRLAPGVEVRIGGIAGFAPETVGRHHSPGGCQGAPAGPTHVRSSVESIEGGVHNDVLIGNGSRNIILGRGGDDRILGMGGDDFVVGGAGRDALLGGPGLDRLYAQDGLRDETINCGLGVGVGGTGIIDSNDPSSIGCRAPSGLAAGEDRR